MNGHAIVYPTVKFVSLLYMKSAFISINIPPVGEYPEMKGHFVYALPILAFPLHTHHTCHTTHTDSPKSGLVLFSLYLSLSYTDVQ